MIQADEQFSDLLRHSNNLADTIRTKVSSIFILLTSLTKNDMVQRYLQETTGMTRRSLLEYIVQQTSNTSEIRLKEFERELGGEIETIKLTTGEEIEVFAETAQLWTRLLKYNKNKNSVLNNLLFTMLFLAEESTSRYIGSALVKGHLEELGVNTKNFTIEFTRFFTSNILAPTLTEAKTPTFPPPVSASQGAKRPTPASPVGSRNTTSASPSVAIKNYTTNLSELARNGELSLGKVKDDTMNLLVRTLNRKVKNNPVLIGPPGVGKTRMVENLAVLSVDWENSPEILSLNMTALVAGTRYRGDFEERFNQVVKECQKNDYILFIDEMHSVLKLGGGEGAMDANGILKPALARGLLRVIGATTDKEFRKYFSNDEAFSRRFQRIRIDEPTKREAVEILEHSLKEYEKYHSVTVDSSLLEHIVEQAVRYIPDRHLPDKAFDLLDDAIVLAKTRNSAPSIRRKTANQDTPTSQIDYYITSRRKAIAEGDVERARKLLEAQKRYEEQNPALANPAVSVSIDDVNQVVESLTGVPVPSGNHYQQAVSLQGVLESEVIGQAEAVVAVSQVVKRQLAGVSDPNRPLGSFLFCGGTGTGKTELSKVLAKHLMGDNLIVLDMSEYDEKHSVAKLFGAPPGYVGYENGGLLTEAVHKKPYSVVLFDEIEKAHPDVFNSLLQILEEGRMTDGQGREINFKNTIIIMTSNLGVSNASIQPVGFSASDDSVRQREHVRSQVNTALKNTFKPELLNRIDEIIVFNPLGEAQIEQILHKQIQKIQDRVQYQFTLTPQLVQHLIQVGTDKAYGARPLRRAIQTHVENALADWVISTPNPQNGQQLVLDWVDGQVTVEEQKQGVLIDG